MNDKKLKLDSFDRFIKKFKSRSDNVYEPTVLGEMAGAEPGSVTDAVVGTPERASRLVLGGMGSAADLLELPITTAAEGYSNAADWVTGGRSSEAMQKIAESFGRSGTGESIGWLINKIKEYRNSLPESGRANFDAAGAGLEGLMNFTPPVTKAIDKTSDALDGSRVAIKRRLDNERGSISIPGGGKDKSMWEDIAHRKLQGYHGKDDVELYNKVYDKFFPDRAEASKRVMEEYHAPGTSKPYSQNMNSKDYEKLWNENFNKESLIDLKNKIEGDFSPGVSGYIDQFNTFDILSKPLIDMPLYINDKGSKGFIAKWRLENGI